MMTLGMQMVVGAQLELAQLDMTASASGAPPPGPSPRELEVASPESTFAPDSDSGVELCPVLEGTPGH